MLSHSHVIKKIALALLAVAILASFLSPTISLTHFQHQHTLLSVPDYTEPNLGDTLVLSVELPTFSEDKALFFYTKDVVVRIYMDDALVYAFTGEEAYAFLKTPGHRWNYVSLPASSSGQTLRLELSSQFPNRFDTTLSTLYFIQPECTADVVLHENGFMLMAGALTAIMALMCYIYGVVWKRKYIKQYYVALANFYLCVSIWVFSMSGFTDLLFHRPILTYLCSVLFASFIPVSIYELVKVICQQQSKRITALGCLLWGNFIGQFALQYLFGVSMLDMIVVTEAVYVLGCLGYLWLMIDHCRACRGTQDWNIPFMTISIMIVGALIEIAVLVLFPAATNLIGMASITGMMLYLVVNQVYLVHGVSVIDLSSVALKRDYNKLQNAGLMEQIKAHFFFNTLNTISALCKTDPAQADRAIILFSKYMRAHMYLINQHDNIPFEEELNLVESTLGIEAIRFPNRFTYSVDTPYMDFDVPPLSIQPLVENAIFHGLRKKNGSGHLTVRTQRQGDTTVVIISDNGVGFDLSQGQSKTSLGIQNLTKRVSIMANGTVSIHSQPGIGTTITLTFPDGMV